MVRNLRDSIPKAIGHFLVRSIQENMQLQLYNQLYSSTDMVSFLDEVKFKYFYYQPEHIRAERESLIKILTVLKNAQKVIKRDPEYVIF